MVNFIEHPKSNYAVWESNSDTTIGNNYYIRILRITENVAKRAMICTENYWMLSRDVEYV